MLGKFFRKKDSRLPDRDLEDVKKICKILFIDDRKFPIVELLIKSGWTNTRLIKDVEYINQAEVKEAHVLFVDIQGVGKMMQFSHEGLGLIKALKEKYPLKKIVVYSAEEQGKIEAFHPALNMADARLSKNSDPYQFEMLIEKFSKEAFCLSDCITRVQTTILNEFGRSMTSDQIIRNIEKAYRSKDYSVSNISKIFSLQNASAVADIISLFLTT